MKSTPQRIAEYIGMHGPISDEESATMFKCSTRTARRGRYLARNMGFTIPEPPPDELPVETLLERKSESFKIYKERHDFNHLIPIKVNLQGPIGICHFGDPHIDDDGCDIDQLVHDVEVVKNTDGMFAGNVGDTNNNWVGRLAHLHENQSTTAKQAWKLVEWFVKSVRWLYLISGNHGRWSGSRDPLLWMMGESGNYGPSSVRFNLQFTNGREVRINARHDFKGYSQWNPAHGAMKAAQMGWRDHILTCGHKHISGYGISVDPATSMISHCIQVSTYKTIDSYAIDNNFPDHTISPHCVTLINPDAEKESELVQVFWSLDYAADYLNFLRRDAA